MWEKLKPTHPEVVIYTQFEDFATIEVEKKTSKLSDIVHYIINVNVIDITEQTFDIYKFDDVEKALSEIRRLIEELYDEIPLYSDTEVEHWIDEFCDIIGEY